MPAGLLLAGPRPLRICDSFSFKIVHAKRLSGAGRGGSVTSVETEPKPFNASNTRMTKGSWYLQSGSAAASQDNNLHF